MARPRSIRVLIADDNRVVRKGLRLQLEQAPGITVIGEAANGRDAVALARSERAHVVLMDLQMPVMHGLEATRQLAGLESDGRVAVVVMTSHAGDSHVLQALDAGAVGYLLKGHDADQLLQAIEAAFRGEAIVSSRATMPVLKELARRRPSSADAAAAALLSQAERRAVGALSGGFTTNEQIADHLHVSVNTIRSQLHTAMKKIGVEDRTGLALWGVRNHLDTPSS
ncbi:response regulator [Microbacterium sp. P07]|uniref:response regulator transcription factor n=1 Tax=Microbacterium sp. P07 TaxID=3366952 RepID=UPI0037450E83